MLLQPPKQIISQIIGQKSNSNSASQGLRGEIKVPADKSIAQRSVIISGIASGKTSIKNFPNSGDPQTSLRAMESLGVQIEKSLIDNELNLIVHGKGDSGLEEPNDVINCENSGTCMRLLMGLLSGHKPNFFTTLTGDQSLQKRPMKRIADPLRSLGAQIFGRNGGNLSPISVIGQKMKGEYIETSIASAQLKSALLLSCLNTESAITVKEPAYSRNHTELMLQQFGAKLEKLDDLTTKLTPSKLIGSDIIIPGDISSAAFLLIAGSIVPNSEITIKEVGLNSTRAGIIQILKSMGAQIETEVLSSSIGEPFGNLTVKSSELHGIEISGSIIANIIDELPIISIAAAQAKGTTIIKDAEELRVKESDRLKAMANLLKGLGVKVEETHDGLIIEGLAGKPFEPINSDFEAGHDHRIAMTVGIASLRSTKPLNLHGAEWANISFPGFFDLLNKLSS
jgi:3-phosphoshikimate 1-carboxyvinyltransferase